MCIRDSKEAARWINIGVIGPIPDPEPVQLEILPAKIDEFLPRFNPVILHEALGNPISIGVKLARNSGVFEVNVGSCVQAFISVGIPIDWTDILSAAIIEILRFKHEIILGERVELVDHTDAVAERIGHEMCIRDSRYRILNLQG